jgi:hypothetical protein
MARKKGIQGFDMSEPKFLISVLDGHDDWAVIICLIGGGQEINTGEAGLPEWFSAIQRDYPHWDVYVSNKLTDQEYTNGENIYSSERPVRMGQGTNQTGPYRLVCLRVSAQVAQARRRRFKTHARNQGRTGSQRHLALCDWTLLITKVPEQWLPLHMARALYTLRWQIKLLFKQWKSILRVPQSATGHAHRLRCELYGKWIAAVWVHRIHAVANTARWKAAPQEIRMDNLYKRLQERAFTLSQLLISGQQAIDSWRQELECLLTHGRKYRQRSRMPPWKCLTRASIPNSTPVKANA